MSSLGDWLKSQNVPAIFGVDTRALIKHLSVSGSTLAKLIIGDDKVYKGDGNMKVNDRILMIG